MSRRDKLFLWAVFLVSLSWALTVGHGLALWDDDYAGWFRFALPRSTPQLLLDWIVPVPVRTEGWAFQNRPAQALAYKIVYSLFGYRAGIFFALKSVFWAGLVTLDSLWVLAVGKSRLAALVPPLLLLASPSVMASFVWHADYGLLAECALSGGLFLGLRCLESARAKLDGTHLAALLVIFLGFGTKAHVKAIPFILLAYAALFHRKEWRRFVLPLATLALAIPWSWRVLGGSAPWWPGSTGSAKPWMTQAWRFRRMLDHLASGFSLWPAQLPHSLSEELGPAAVGLLAVVAALLVNRIRIDPLVKRSLALVLLWTGASTLVTGALPDLPPFFAVRYGVLALSPLSVLAGIALSQLLPALGPVSVIAVATLAVTLGASSWCNTSLSIDYRDSLGSVTRAVDASYQFVDHSSDRAPILLLPGFLDFDYRADSSVVSRKRSVGTLAQALDRSREHPWALGWEPLFIEKFGLVRVFNGCQGFAFRSARCQTRAYLYRLGEAPEAAAPSLLSRFMSGLAAADAGDNAQFLAVFDQLVRDAPTVQVRYNHALALQRNGRYEAALPEWRQLISEGVHDQGTLLNALATARAASDVALEHQINALLRP